MTKVAWILLAGEFTSPWRLPRDNEIIIAVDGGMIHAKHFGGRIEHWLGDFDSTSPELIEQYSQQTREIFPTDKDKTDFELALTWLQENHPTIEMVFIIGGYGKEIDHVFSNLWVLPNFPFQGVIFTPYGTQLISTGQTTWHLTGTKKAKVSIFALTKIVGLSSYGLRWSVNNIHVDPFSACASRNEMATENAQIHWQDGSGVVFLAPEVRIFDLA